jgi:NAD(P)-dependent dehydrogenase (short-subunit alcohol dehydrogenase family)
MAQKTALVTGSTSGIGHATALALAKEGYYVIISGRNEERGKSVVKAIADAGGSASFVQVDLSDKASADRLAKESLAAAPKGEIDVLVNNAGRGMFKSTAETTEEEFNNTISLNAKVPFFLVAALAPLMAKRGGGAIINISTMVSQFGMLNMPVYGASKAALNLLTKSWAAEFGPKGVRVNVVSPGPTKTGVVSSDMLDRLSATTPAGKPSTPEDIAAAVVFLASDGAKQIHGNILNVDGGRVAV